MSALPSLKLLSSVLPLPTRVSISESNFAIFQAIRKASAGGPKVRGSQDGEGGQTNGWWTLTAWWVGQRKGTWGQEQFVEWRWCRQK